MGQVYRATDSTLDRDVAIKILLADTTPGSEQFQRFEQEARAAGALNHPNILAIYDIGSEEGVTYVVSELLEGETLRDRIRNNNSLPSKKILDYSQQIARGLAAAHAKGIVHRDLKPENVFITTDGHVKILDFGLAKLINPLADINQDPEAETMRVKTRAGTIMGTVGYMSPEQVKGAPVDHRSDIFSFGVVFYEMLTGKRAFRGESPIEVMSAILSKEPPEPTETERQIAPAFERIVRHCLEKRPEDRFQSTKDLAFDLESLSGTFTTSGSTWMKRPAEKARRSKLLWGGLAVALAVGSLGAAGYFLGQNSVSSNAPSYHQLTFRRGSIYTARFAADGATVIFSATWNGNPLDIYELRSGTSESKPLGLTNALVLSVSSTGEMAVLLNSRQLYHSVRRGTLARMPFGGGAAREMLENVQEADWGPNGSLAVVRSDPKGNHLEYPIGKTLYQTGGYISNPRVSPNGDAVAFLDHPIDGDDRGGVMLVDSNGQKKKLTGDWSGEDGLAWSPDGKEIWFTATKGGGAQALFAVTLDGKERVVARAPVSLRLHDISREGQVLITGDNQSTPISCLVPNETKERDFSWLNSVRVNDLSNDGKTLVFTHFGQSSGINYHVYLGKTDGTPAIQIGDGYGGDLSPDGKWISSVLSSTPQIILLPAGAGQTKPLERFGIEQFGYGTSWLPDGKSIVFSGKESGRLMRTYVQDITGGQPRPITPEGVTGTLISPDGQFLLARDLDEKQPFAVYPVNGGDPRPVPGLEDEDRVIRWGLEGRYLYIYRPQELPLRIFKLNLLTGKREPGKEIMPADLAGIRGPINVLMTPDGTGYIYAFTRYLSDLHLVSGLH